MGDLSLLDIQHHFAASSDSMESWRQIIPVEVEIGGCFNLFGDHSSKPCQDYSSQLWSPVGQDGDLAEQEAPLRAYTKRMSGLREI